MIVWRNLIGVAVLGVLSMKATTCRSPGQGDSGADTEQKAKSSPMVELKQVDTSELTPREKRAWSGHVRELLAPCPSQPVSLFECIEEARDCAGCTPAAQYLAKLVRRGLTESQIETVYRKRFSPEEVHDIEVGDSPAKGPKDAPVTIVEWADFECPACQTVQPLLEELLAAYPDHVRLVFKNFPLNIHQHAEKAARAAMAAHRQGKFWTVHEKMFEARPPLDRAKIERIAREAGLDMDKFVADMESEAIADRVNLDRKQGEKVDIQATPSFFINGRPFTVMTDFEQDLREWIELEVQLKTGKEVEPKPAGKQPAPDDAKLAKPASEQKKSADAGTKQGKTANPKGE